MKKLFKTIYDFSLDLRTKKNQPLLGYFTFYYDCYNYYAIWFLFFCISWRIIAK